MKRKSFLKVNYKDNVAVALYQVNKGAKINIDGQLLIVLEIYPKSIKLL